MFGLRQNGGQAQTHQTEERKEAMHGYAHDYTVTEVLGDTK